jgi:hypothetical protein
MAVQISKVEASHKCMMPNEMMEQYTIALRINPLFMFTHSSLHPPTLMSKYEPINSVTGLHDNMICG